MKTPFKMKSPLKGKRGLWDNIHAKRKRIKAGSGEKMRKPGFNGPSFIASAYFDAPLPFGAVILVVLVFNIFFFLCLTGDPKPEKPFILYPIIFLFVC